MNINIFIIKAFYHIIIDKPISKGKYCSSYQYTYKI